MISFTLPRSHPQTVITRGVNPETGEERFITTVLLKSTSKEDAQFYSLTYWNEFTIISYM